MIIAFAYQNARHYGHIARNFGNLVSEADGCGHWVSKAWLPGMQR
jgi:hypothetical protein